MNTAPRNQEAGPQPISLDLASRQLHLDPTFKQEIATQVMGLMKWSLGTILFISALTFFADTIAIFCKVYGPSDRLLNEAVFKMLIAATVVEVGAAFAVIVTSAFKSE